MELVSPAVTQAISLEVRWASTLIKVGKLSWLSELDASAKAHMSKDALAVVAHAMTFQKFQQDNDENARHWMWNEAKIGELTNGGGAAKTLGDFFADWVALSSVPAETALELGLVMEPVAQRFEKVASGLLEGLNLKAAKVLEASEKLLNKYGKVVPAAGALEWNKDLLVKILDVPEVEKDMSQLNSCLPAVGVFAQSVAGCVVGGALCFLFIIYEPMNE